MVPVLKKLYKDFGNIVQLSVAGQKGIILFDPEDYMQIHTKGVNPEGATDALVTDSASRKICFKRRIQIFYE